MPRQATKEVTELRTTLWEATQGMCEWPRCPAPAREMAHRKGKGMGGRASRYFMCDVFALCTFHHRCQDGEGGEVISGRSRREQVEVLYTEVDPDVFPGDLLIALDGYVHDMPRQRNGKRGLKSAITEALALYAFAGRTPRTEDRC